VVAVVGESRLSFKINDHPRREISLARSLARLLSLSLSLTPTTSSSSQSRSRNWPETIPLSGLRRLTRHNALRMTCGRWTNAIGSKGAPAFPPPYAPPSILVRLKRRFQSSRSDRAHAHAFAASTTAPRGCVHIRIRHRGATFVPKSSTATLDRALAIHPMHPSRGGDSPVMLLFNFFPPSKFIPMRRLSHPSNSPQKERMIRGK